MAANVYPVPEITLGNFRLDTKPNFNAKLGHRIRHAREENGLTQAQLGAIMAKPRSHAAISDIEKGKTRITVSLLYELAILLGTTPAELMADL